MTNRFVISVPIGAYHPLLKQCLQSLAVQEPRPRVALMDASDDARVQALADAFDDIIVYRRHGPDQGQADAIIEGWRHVDGEILGWLNADDILFPDALQRASGCFNARLDADVVCGHSTIINDDYEVTGYHWAVSRPDETLLTGDTISQPSCFFKRELYERVGGMNADLHYTMDWDLWVRFWRAGAGFEFIDEVLSQVLWTADAKTGGLNKRRRQEIGDILDAYASPEARVKSRLGFALHYLFEYVLPKPFARALRHRFSPSAARICGLGRNGEVEDGFEIPLCHYEDAAVKRFVISFLKGAEHVSRVTLDGCEARISRDGQRVIVELPEPFECGEKTTLSIETTGTASVLFSGLGFDRREF